MVAVESAEHLEKARDLRALLDAVREAQTLQEALARGVFGVPTCLLGDRLFWGNDRLALLEHALRQAGPSKDTST